MTKIKLCGMRRECDIEYANELNPEYIGFVFAKSSKRYITPEDAYKLRQKLNKNIIAVGVFVDEHTEEIARIVNKNIIQAVQLHGNEDNIYIEKLKKIINCKIIKAFRIEKSDDMEKVNNSLADYILLDSGKGSGEVFDWSLIKEIRRPYFLAGGLTPKNVSEAILKFHPFGVDASSSLETDGFKDKQKMKDFVQCIRERQNHRYERHAEL